MVDIILNVSEMEMKNKEWRLCLSTGSAFDAKCPGVIAPTRNEAFEKLRTVVETVLRDAGDEELTVTVTMKWRPDWSESIPHVPEHLLLKTTSLEKVRATLQKMAA